MEFSELKSQEQQLSFLEALKGKVQSKIDSLIKEKTYVDRDFEGKLLEFEKQTSKLKLTEKDKITVSFYFERLEEAKQELKARQNAIFEAEERIKMVKEDDLSWETAELRLQSEFETLNSILLSGDLIDLTEYRVTASFDKNMLFEMLTDKLQLNSQILEEIEDLIDSSFGEKYFTESLVDLVYSSVKGAKNIREVNSSTKISLRLAEISGILGGRIKLNTSSENAKIEHLTAEIKGIEGEIDKIKTRADFNSILEKKKINSNKIESLEKALEGVEKQFYTITNDINREINTKTRKLLEIDNQIKDIKLCKLAQNKDKIQFVKSNAVSLSYKNTERTRDTVKNRSITVLNSPERTMTSDLKGSVLPEEPLKLREKSILSLKESRTLKGSTSRSTAILSLNDSKRKTIALKNSKTSSKTDSNINGGSNLDTSSRLYGLLRGTRAFALVEDLKSKKKEGFVNLKEALSYGLNEYVIVLKEKKVTFYKGNTVKFDFSSISSLEIPDQTKRILNLTQELREISRKGLDKKTYTSKLTSNLDKSLLKGIESRLFSLRIYVQTKRILISTQRYDDFKALVLAFNSILS